MGKAEEAAQHQIQNAEVTAPPPAYFENASSTGTVQQEQPPPYPSDIKLTHQINRQFPPSFNAYYQWKFTKTFHLGQSRDQPLYAVRTHSGWSGSPGIVLHNGPSDKDPPLAAAGNEGSWSKHSIVILPPLNPGEGESSESMRTNVSWKTVTYSFSIDLGTGTRENFEWRQSRGGEIKSLDKHARGWKLVRLGSNTVGPGGERKDRAPGATSDGKEIVAVWVLNSGWSMTKSFKFQFMGSGLTGELGERWAVMAVITALRIWYIQIAGTASSGAAAGAAAGTAAAVAA